MRKRIKDFDLVAPKWRSSADLAVLRERAALLDEMRTYFCEQGVLAVDTPLLMPSTTPDPAVQSFVAYPDNKPVSTSDAIGYLQTSPEFAMKRLLASGSGDIYQICPAFRAEESGPHHLCEFTLLEWYRVGFDHHRLMDDVRALLNVVVPNLPVSRIRYDELFRSEFEIDPYDAATDELALAAANNDVELGAARDDRATVLDALFSVASHRRRHSASALFVYDFPIEQAAYARIAAGPPAYAQRFELLIGDLEIANGYFEVTDPNEQMRRFASENARRGALGLPFIQADAKLIAGLKAGLPSCAGVALGVERLLMQRCSESHIAEVVSFGREFEDLISA